MAYSGVSNNWLCNLPELRWVGQEASAIIILAPHLRRFTYKRRSLVSKNCVTPVEYCSLRHAHVLINTEILH